MFYIYFYIYFQTGVILTGKFLHLASLAYAPGSVANFKSQWKKYLEVLYHKQVANISPGVHEPSQVLLNPGGLIVSLLIIVKF